MEPHRVEPNRCEPNPNAFPWNRWNRPNRTENEQSFFSGHHFFFSPASAVRSTFSSSARVYFSTVVLLWSWRMVHDWIPSDHWKSPNKYVTNNMEEHERSRLSDLRMLDGKMLEFYFIRSFVITSDIECSRNKTSIGIKWSCLIRILSIVRLFQPGRARSFQHFLQANHAMLTCAHQEPVTPKTLKSLWQNQSGPIALAAATC